MIVNRRTLIAVVDDGHVADLDVVRRSDDHLDANGEVAVTSMKFGEVWIEHDVDRIRRSATGLTRHRRERAGVLIAHVHPEARAV